MPKVSKKKGAKKENAVAVGTTPVQGIEALMAQVDAVYGKGTILPADRAVSLVVDWIPLGIFDFDVRSGGGFPRGRITMLTGEYSSWKTALALKGMASAQRHCRQCGTPFEVVGLLGDVTSVRCKCGANDPGIGLWVDAEHTFDPAWAAKWGVDCSRLVLLEPESAEQAIDVVDKAIRTKACDFVVIDSIAALTPIIESEAAASDQQMGVAAKLYGKACRKWTAGMNSYGLLAQTKCTLVLINQLRQKIGDYGKGMTAPGGKSFEFFETLGVKTKREEYIVDEATGRNIGAIISYKILKNKAFPPSIPFGEFSLYFSNVFGTCAVGSTNTSDQVVRHAEYWRLVVRSGSWYSYKEIKEQGKAAFMQTLKGRPEYIEELMSTIKAREQRWNLSGEAVVGEDSL